ncbi:4Fe-4S binding domain-containing protein [Mesobacillus persicus]|uniref:4Fe-4S binding domain-containing protein n=1 Tax=Mesobacillus persicus TaxID=930146 RepID=A0A1H8I1U1_9BACI|nr:4Fe-4S binding protein [Mesobacillus persicus]SEN62493.1 4Fe-4S binding domain-containing protein [Mesobacillus persicus]
MKTKQYYYRQLKRRPLVFVRHGVKIAFFLFTLFIGLEFYQFYLHFSSATPMPYVERPGAVEAFLPVSAMMGFRVWVATGEFDAIHPAGLVLFTFFVGSGFLFRRSFCSWICPVGTGSEWVGMLGKKMFKREFNLPKWIGWNLLPIKYILLGFFIFMVINMPIDAVIGFLMSPYNLISDVKMLQYFLEISATTIKVLGVIFILSLFFKNFWCRFLCPYGALIGLGSMLGMTKIKRNVDTCSNCNQCTRACPQGISITEKKTVMTPECTACMQCVEACPVKETLTMQVGPTKVNKWVVPFGFLALFAIVVLAAKATGHWDTVLTYEHFKELIPWADYIN